MLSFETVHTVLAVGNGEYTLPFKTAVGQVRVNMSGRLYEAAYRAAGLTGYDNSDYHDGANKNRAAFDFALNADTPIYAAAPGTVVWDKTNSCQIVIKNEGTGELVYYIHVVPTVGKGTSAINRFDKIATVATKKQCGYDPHLHFAVWKGNSEITVSFMDVSAQTSNGKTCPAGLICPSHGNYVEFRYPTPNNCTVNCSAGKLELSQGLSLSTTSPTINQSVTASFKVKNVGGSPMTLQSLSAGARQGTDWNGVNVDFPAVANITLQPGQEYSYQQSRSFGVGAYFAEPVVLVAGKWSGIPLSNGGYSRVVFNVNSNVVFNNGVSRLWQDGNYNRANLTITANNLNGQNICVHFWRSGRDFGVVCKRATSNSITFYDLDGAGPMNGRTTYYSQAAMNQNPNYSWPAPGCAGPTGGQGLCDKIYRP